MSEFPEWDEDREREEMRERCVERGQCPDCGARLFRGLCPKCSFDAHPEREVKKKVFPEEV